MAPGVVSVGPRTITLPAPSVVSNAAWRDARPVTPVRFWTGETTGPRAKLNACGAANVPPNRSVCDSRPAPSRTSVGAVGPNGVPARRFSVRRFRLAPARALLKITVNGPPLAPTTVTLPASPGIVARWAWTAAAVVAPEYAIGVVPA